MPNYAPCEAEKRVRNTRPPPDTEPPWADDWQAASLRLTQCVPSRTRYT